jgi:hypothetical protein
LAVSADAASKATVHAAQRINILKLGKYFIAQKMPVRVMLSKRHACRVERIKLIQRTTQLTQKMAAPRMRYCQIFKTFFGRRDILVEYPAAQ